MINIKILDTTILKQYNPSKDYISFKILIDVVDIDSIEFRIYQFQLSTDRDINKLSNFL